MENRAGHGQCPHLSGFSLLLISAAISFIALIYFALPNFRNLSDGLIAALIHRDALYSQEDIDWMNQAFNLDIGETELLDFFEENLFAVG
jgi:hypothetical protein